MLLCNEEAWIIQLILRNCGNPVERGVQSFGNPDERGGLEFWKFQSRGGVENRTRPWWECGYFLETPNNAITIIREEARFKEML